MFVSSFALNSLAGGSDNISQIFADNSGGFRKRSTIAVILDRYLQYVLYSVYRLYNVCQVLSRLDNISSVTAFRKAVNRIGSFKAFLSDCSPLIRRIWNVATASDPCRANLGVGGLHGLESPEPTPVVVLFPITARKGPKQGGKRKQQMNELDKDTPPELHGVRRHDNVYGRRCERCGKKSRYYCPICERESGEKGATLCFFGHGKTCFEEWHK